MRQALIIGGGGQVGRATARRLLASGWRVVCAQRSQPPDIPGVEILRLDRDAPGALAAAVGEGVDALIDCVAFDEAHARQLIEIQARVGAFVVISSASVYRDAKGRTLDEARESGFPRLPVPLTEDQPTVEPGPATYSTPKAALERALLDGLSRPVAILRPGAIYGEGSAHCREWFFVRRILDGRRAVPLAWSGASRFHASASANIAALIETALDRPTTAILHAADPHAMTAVDVGEAVAEAMAAPLELVPFDGPPAGGVGAHPWAIPHPVVLDTSRAVALGWRPVSGYANLVGETCRWAAAFAADGGQFIPYVNALFDYPAEDAWLAARGAG